jgi:hypothetical protein
VKSEKAGDQPLEDMKKSLGIPLENDSKASLYRALEDSISGMATIIANIIRFCIDHIGVPSSAQVTFFFFGLLVLSNVFLLKKMSYVDKQLSDLTTSHISSVRGISTATLAQEREHLWQQLRHTAQDKTKAQDDVAKLWNKRTMEILRQKAMLDQQILGMQAVIRGAEDQLDTLRPATSKKQN